MGKTTNNLEEERGERAGRDGTAVVEGHNYICERLRQMEGFSEWPQVSSGV